MGDDEVDNVAAISNVAIMVESSEALNVIDNSTDDIDLPTEADDYVNILVSLKWQPKWNGFHNRMSGYHY